LFARQNPAGPNLGEMVIPKYKEMMTVLNEHNVAPTVPGPVQTTLAEKLEREIKIYVAPDRS
jgi:hypothetical protein